MYPHYKEIDGYQPKYCGICRGMGKTLVGLHCGFCGGSGLKTKASSAFMKFHPCYCGHGDSVLCMICRKKCHHDSSMFKRNRLAPLLP